MGNFSPKRIAGYCAANQCPARSRVAPVGGVRWPTAFSACRHAAVRARPSAVQRMPPPPLLARRRVWPRARCYCTTRLHAPRPRAAAVPPPMRVLCPRSLITMHGCHTQVRAWAQAQAAAAGRRRREPQVRAAGAPALRASWFGRLPGQRFAGRPLRRTPCSAHVRRGCWGRQRPAAALWQGPRQWASQTLWAGGAPQHGTRAAQKDRGGGGLGRCIYKPKNYLVEGKELSSFILQTNIHSY